MESLNNGSVNESNFHLRVYSQVINSFQLHHKSIGFTLLLS